MAAVEDEVDERFKDIDIDSLLSKVQRRPLTFNRKKSVYTAPDFLQRLKGEETVDEGSDLTLSFQVNGVPKPTLRWFKDDEEVKDHPRLTVEDGEDGKYRLTLHQVNKGDEAAYRCRAENREGASSCCFFLSVKGKAKSPKRDGKKSHKRTVSFPTMFSTIVEKVEEEEQAGKEASRAAESPLSQFYNSLTLKGRTTWPSFIGDWAFVNGTHKARGGSTGSYPSTGSESDLRNPDDIVRIFADAEGWEPDDVFLDPTEADGFASDFAEAQDVVFFLQTSAKPTHRVGSVPSDANSTPAEVTARGKAGPSSLRSPVLGLTDSSKLSPSREGGKTSVTSPPVKDLVKSSETVFSAGRNAEVTNTVINDNAKPAAASTDIKDSQHGSRSSLTSSSLPSSVAKPRLAASQASSGPQSSNNGTVFSAPSQGLLQTVKSQSNSVQDEKSGKISVVSGGSTKPQPDSKPGQVVVSSRSSAGDFSLTVTPRGGQDRSAKPLTVRGPLGALISGEGDSGRRTSTTSRVSSTSLTNKLSGVSALKGSSGSVSPSVLVTSESREKSGKMCDCSNREEHTCDCSSSEESSCAPRPPMSRKLGQAPSYPSSPCSSGTLSPISSGGSFGLLVPDFEREEREPTPIPPDHLIVTHNVTGNAVLIQAYRGNGPAGVPRLCQKMSDEDMHDSTFTSETPTQGHETRQHEAGSITARKAASMKGKRVQLAVQQETEVDKMGPFQYEVSAEEPKPDVVPNPEPGVKPLDKNPLFFKKPGETFFTKSSMRPEHYRTAGELSAQPHISLPPTSRGGLEALYFDPVHQELVHVKRLNPDPEPLRSRSVDFTPNRANKTPRVSLCPKSNDKTEHQRPGSATASIYSSIATDPERHLVYQYILELVFAICLLTFLGLLFSIQPHIFVGVVLSVHLGLFFSRRYIFVRK